MDPPLLRLHVDGVHPLRAGVPIRIRPGVADPDVAALELQPEVVRLVPEEADQVLLRDQEVTLLRELIVGHRPGIRDPVVIAGDHEHLQRVDPRDPLRVAGVPQQAPGILGRLHVVRVVHRSDVAPVLRDEVLLPVDLPELLEERAQLRVVLDQRRVPRLDETTVDVVLEPVRARVNHVIRCVAGRDLREAVVVVREQDELRGVSCRCLVGIGEDLDLLLRVVLAATVSGPVEDLESARLLRDRRSGGPARKCRARRGLLARCQYPGTRRDTRVAHEVSPSESLRDEPIEVVRHLSPLEAAGRASV